MKHAEKIAPVAAALSALTTLACCLPIAFAAGTAVASLALVAGTYRWAFLGAAAVLLAVGAVELVRVRRACHSRQAASTVILAASGAIVVLVVLFPQVIASLLADWMP
jgi:hypothetical protein